MGISDTTPSNKYGYDLMVAAYKAGITEPGEEAHSLEEVEAELEKQKDENTDSGDEGLQQHGAGI